MSAPKKITSKSAKSPAPAIKSAAASPAVKKKTTTAKTIRSTTETPVAMLAPSPVAPVLNSVAPKPVVTTITARLDVGFGNALFVRGEGPGLSWEKGLAMECVGPDLWRAVLEGSARSYTFKLLVNDLSWSAGPDFTAACGTSITLTPEF